MTESLRDDGVPGTTTSPRSAPSRRKWTKDSVREELACVDAEWQALPGSGWCFAAGEMLTVCVGRRSRGGAPFFDIGVVWVPDGPLVEDDDSYVVARPGVTVWQHGPAVSPADIRPALLATRALVLATHGADAWPWPMREETSP